MANNGKVITFVCKRGFFKVLTAMHPVDSARMFTSVSSHSRRNIKGSWNSKCFLSEISFMKDLSLVHDPDWNQGWPIPLEFQGLQLSMPAFGSARQQENNKYF